MADRQIRRRGFASKPTRARPRVRRCGVGVVQRATQRFIPVTRHRWFTAGLAEPVRGRNCNRSNAVGTRTGQGRGMTSNHPTFALTIPAEGKDPRPAMVRVRSMLKLMLRAFGLRCLTIREVE